MDNALENIWDYILMRENQVKMYIEVLWDLGPSYEHMLAGPLAQLAELSTLKSYVDTLRSLDAENQE